MLLMGVKQGIKSPVLFGAIPDVTIREKKIDFFTILGDLHEVCLKASTMCNSHRF